MCGIHPCRITDGIAVGITVVSIHELAVDVEFQVIIEERRIQCHARSRTLEITRLQNTVLVSVTYTHAIRHVLQTALYSDTMVCRHSRMEDL